MIEAVPEQTSETGPRSRSKPRALSAVAIAVVFCCPTGMGLHGNRADRDANPTALLVCGDQQSMPFVRAELLDEGAQIVSRCSVVVEVDDQQAAVLVPRPVGEH